MKPGKYGPLTTQLAGLKANRWVASLAELESVLGFKLPKSARAYQAFWSHEANPRQPHKRAVREAGWRVTRVDLPREILEFERAATGDYGTTNKKPQARRRQPNPMPEITKETETRISAAYAWGRLGKVSLDGSGQLSFPLAPNAPGLYRFELIHREEMTVYVGEGADLSRRFQNYRTPGPTQRTNRRLNEDMKKTLRAQGTISVSIVTEATVHLPNGVERPAILSEKSERVFLEHAALTLHKSQGLKTLNL